MRAAGLLTNDSSRPMLENFLSRLAAILALASATVILARVGGPDVVGHYAVLRMLPWLVSMLATAGYEGALVFFLAGAHGSDRRTRSTIVAILAVGAGLGAVMWLIATPVLGGRLLPDLPRSLVAASALLVPARGAVAVARQCLQGEHDLRGSNVNIVAEAGAFLPMYGLAIAAGLDGGAAVLAALLAGDVMTAGSSWRRLLRRGFLSGVARPSMEVARRLLGFGIRTNSGYLLQLMNLRFDVVLIGAVAGAATVGTYAVASRFAELTLLLPLSVMYVLQPRYTSMDRTAAAAAAKRALPITLGVTALATVPIALAAELVLPLLYGEAFHAAVMPAQILAGGLIGTSISSVITAFLYGDGRPGIVSIAAGMGVVAMVALDLVLIPQLGAVGAAIASSISYLLVALALWVCFRIATRAQETSAAPHGLAETTPPR